LTRKYWNLGRFKLFFSTDLYISLSCFYLNILDLSWREISWRFLFCEHIVGRWCIEVKCCLEDDHYVTSWGYVCNVGSRVQQFMYVNRLISWEAYVLYKDCEWTLQPCADKAQPYISTRLCSSSLFSCAVLTWVISTVNSFNTHHSQFIRLLTYQNCNTNKPALHR
jgi:hypothetical protein